MLRRHLALVALVGLASRGSAQAGRRVVIDRFAYRLGSIGETVAANAGVLDASLRLVPKANIVWRIDHPTIATVSARGIVQARTVGRTLLWAVAGRDSTSAVILVMVSGNTIDFSPSPLQFEEDGHRLLLRIQLLDAAGVALADLTRAAGPCRSRNNQVASLLPNGQVLSRGTGVTYIQCTSRGVSDSVRVEVGPRQGKVGMISRTGAPPPAQLSTGDTVRFRARGDSAGALTAAADTPRVAALPAYVPSVRPDTLKALARDTSRAIVPSVPPGANAVASIPQQQQQREQQQQRARQAARDSAAAAADLRAERRLAGRLLSVTATASHTTHSTRFARRFSESRAGLLAGGTASLAPSARWLAGGDYRVGMLTGGQSSDGDLKVTEVTGQLTYWGARWLGVRSGYTMRSESTNLVLHRWQFVNVTALSRLALREGAITSVTALSLLPWGSFSGHVDDAGKPIAPNPTSFALATGLEFDLGLMRAGIMYSTERFAFPELNGVPRRDRFSTLRIGVGIQTGPRNQPMPRR